MQEDGVGPTDPYGQGMDAHARRVARAACPYPEGSEERERWLGGWDHQRLSEGDLGKLES
ncbi:MAG: hypothetical protein JWM75_2574 [Sphingomonas bacterium]|nr:hypothetical protein [Sphingomonas bacterium]